MRLTMVVAMTRELVLIAVLPLLTVCSLVTSAQTAGWSQPVNLKVNDIRETEFVSMAVSPGGKVFALWQSNNQPPYALRAQIFLRIKEGQSWPSPTASGCSQTQPPRPISIGIMLFSGENYLQQPARGNV